MKNFKKIVFGFILVSIAVFGITACSNNVDLDGDDLNQAVEEDSTWLLGSWKCTTTYEVSSGVVDVSEYVPEDTEETIVVDDDNLAAIVEDIKNLIEKDELYNQLKEAVSEVPSAKLKASSDSVVNEDRTKITVMKKYKLTAMLVVSAKATVTVVWEKQ